MIDVEHIRRLREKYADLAADLIRQTNTLKTMEQNVERQRKRVTDALSAASAALDALNDAEEDARPIGENSE